MKLIKVVDSPTLRKEAAAAGRAKRRAMNNRETWLPVVDAAIQSRVSSDVIQGMIRARKLTTRKLSKGVRNAHGNICWVLVSVIQVARVLAERR